MPELKPVAEIRSIYGDPMAFGERELVATTDIQGLPYGTRLYAIPADQVLVPRELLERVSNAIWQESISRTGHPSPLSDQLRALLQR